MPAVMRVREGTPLRSAERFRRGMESIAPGSPPLAQDASSQPDAAQPDAPAPRRRPKPAPVPEDRRSRRAAVRRRQRLRTELLGFLATAAFLSGMAAVAIGGVLWEVNLAFDAALGLYVVVLLDDKRRRLERTTKVRRIRRPAPVRELDFEERAQLAARRG